MASARTHLGFMESRRARRSGAAGAVVAGQGLACEACPPGADMGTSPGDVENSSAGRSRNTCASCGRNAAIAELRRHAGDDAGAASATKWVGQCHVEGLQRY